MSIKVLENDPRYQEAYFFTAHKLIFLQEIPYIFHFQLDTLLKEFRYRFRKRIYLVTVPVFI